jgi:O-methyltransferase
VLTALIRNALKHWRGTPPEVQRRPGSWHHADLDWMAAKVRRVPGDFAEIGVFQGAAFRRVATLAAAQNRLAHAFDSFRGMDEPSVHDGQQYPKGKFDIGGPERFVALMEAAEVPRDAYRLWPGYVPACFAGCPGDLRFALAILDLDHYEPTVEGLRWLAPRIVPGGLLALDDWLPATDLLATRAIKEFLAQRPPFAVVAEMNQQIILRRR